MPQDFKLPEDIHLKDYIQQQLRRQEPTQCSACKISLACAGGHLEHHHITYADKSGVNRTHHLCKQCHKEITNLNSMAASLTGGGHSPKLTPSDRMRLYATFRALKRSK